MNIDLGQTNAFLSALGKSHADARIRAFYPKGHPLKTEDKGWKGRLNQRLLQQKQDQGRGLYVVIGNGGDCDSQIIDVPALFVEWDDKPIEWQVTAWRELGLPEPSLQVDTGGRSIHCYWILDQPMPKDEWCDLQLALLTHCEADLNIKNASRVMRLPGSWYMDGKGEPVKMAQIIHDSGLRYSKEDIANCIPKQLQVREPVNVVRKNGTAATVEFVGSGAIPIADLLPRKTREVALAGVAEGGRNQECFRLAAVALAVAEGAAAAGITVQGSAEELVFDFAARCSPPLAEREALACLRSAESQPRTPDRGLQKRIDYHTKPRKGKAQKKQASRGCDESNRGCSGNGEGGGHGDDDRGDDRPERLDRLPIICLGFNGDDYFYQSGDSGQVTRITKSQHSSSTSLVSLCDLRLWESVYPRTNNEGEVIGVSWKESVNDLFRRQHRVGIFDPSRIRGVGAWIDEGKPVFHLGDRLLIAGKDYSVFEPPPSRYLYQRLPRRIGPGDATPLTDIEGERLIGIADRFHWEEPVSGMLLAGWIALAPICGALDWRPHVWLQAIAGSGKTTVLNRFVSPLLSDLKLKVLGATTEAGIRQRLRCDAIPVIFDESESNLKKDVERIQSVLALARIASSESDGVTLKGSAMGESMQFNIRSMFLLSSIATALRQGADESRFCVLTLRIPDTLSAEDKDQRWRELEADLIATVTYEVGRRLAARMITLIPVVREATQTFARHVAMELGSARVGDQVGALLAGAWALWNRRPPTDAEAADYIAAAEWGTQRIQAMEGGGDQRRCLDIILQKRLRVDVEHGSLSLTVAELIEIAGGPSSPLDPVSKDAAEAELGRNGIRVTESNTLLIANRASGIAAMLRDTPWSDFGWANLLGSLPGAEKNKQSRYKGLGKTSVRSVELPISLLQ